MSAQSVHDHQLPGHGVVRGQLRVRRTSTVTLTVGKATLTVTASSPARRACTAQAGAGGTRAALTAASSQLGEDAVRPRRPQLAELLERLRPDDPGGQYAADHQLLGRHVRQLRVRSHVDGTFTVGKATLTVTAGSAKACTYGQAAPAYTFGVTGFQNSENAATADGYSSPTCSSDYTPTTPVASTPRTSLHGRHVRQLRVRSHRDGTVHRQHGHGQPAPSRATRCRSIPPPTPRQASAWVSTASPRLRALTCPERRTAPSAATPIAWTFTDVTGNYINQTGTVSDTILLVGASLKVTKTTSATAVHVGDAFAYTIKVKNTAAIASGTFTVTDVLPPEVTFASFGGPLRIRLHRELGHDRLHADRRHLSPRLGQLDRERRGVHDRARRSTPRRSP